MASTGINGLTSNFLQELLTHFRLSWSYGFTQQALSFQDTGLLICLSIFKIPFPLSLICKYRLPQCDAENNYTSFIQWRLRLGNIKKNSTLFIQWKHWKLESVWPLVSCIKGTILSKVNHICYSVTTVLFTLPKMSLRQLMKKTSKCPLKALLFF